MFPKNLDGAAAFFRNTFDAVEMFQAKIVR